MMRLAWIALGFKWIGHTHKGMSFQVYTWYVHIPCFEFDVFVQTAYSIYMGSMETSVTSGSKFKLPAKASAKSLLLKT
jgi:hypothetical protein